MQHSESMRRVQTVRARLSGDGGEDGNLELDRKSRRQSVGDELLQLLDVLVLRRCDKYRAMSTREHELLAQSGARTGHFEDANDCVERERKAVAHPHGR